MPISTTVEISIFFQVWRDRWVTYLYNSRDFYIFSRHDGISTAHTSTTVEISIFFQEGF